MAPQLVMLSMQTLAILLCAFGGAFLPIFIANTSEMALSVCNSFAAGEGAWRYLYGMLCPSIKVRVGAAMASLLRLHTVKPLG